MSAVYLESSALLAWLLAEPEEADIRTAIDAADTVVTSVLTLLETERALVRVERESVLRAKDVQALRGMLRRAQASWMLMELVGSVRERAARPFPVEPLRTLDAIHLATALEFSSVFPDLELLSLDQRIQANAEPLGLPSAIPGH